MKNQPNKDTVKDGSSIAEEVLRQILSLGQQHHAKLLGDLIIYGPNSEFNPQA